MANRFMEVEETNIGNAPQIQPLDGESLPPRDEAVEMADETLRTHASLEELKMQIKRLHFQNPEIDLNSIPTEVTELDNLNEQQLLTLLEGLKSRIETGIDENLTRKVTESLCRWIPKVQTEYLIQDVMEDNYLIRSLQNTLGSPFAKLPYILKSAIHFGFHILNNAEQNPFSRKRRNEDIYEGGEDTESTTNQERQFTMENTVQNGHNGSEPSGEIESDSEYALERPASRRHL